MSLDLFALFLSQLFDLAAHDTECSAQDRGQPLVKVAFASVPDHDQFVLWRNRNVNPHPKRIPASLMFLRLLDGHVTANEVITDAFELCSLLVDERFKVWRFANVTESDLQRNLHKFNLQSYLLSDGQQREDLSPKIYFTQDICRCQYF